MEVVSRKDLKLTMITCKIGDWKCHHNSNRLTDILLHIMKWVSQTNMVPVPTFHLRQNFQAIRKCASQPTTKCLSSKCQVLNLRIRLCTSPWIWILWKIICPTKVIQVSVFPSSRCLIRWCRIITKIRSIILEYLLKTYKFRPQEMSIRNILGRLRVYLLETLPQRNSRHQHNSNNMKWRLPWTPGCLCICHSKFKSLLERRSKIWLNRRSNRFRCLSRWIPGTKILCIRNGKRTQSVTTKR